MKKELIITLILGTLGLPVTASLISAKPPGILEIITNAVAGFVIALLVSCVHALKNGYLTRGEP